jgi:hypothetical protein
VTYEQFSPTSPTDKPIKLFRVALTAKHDLPDDAWIAKQIPAAWTKPDKPSWIYSETYSLATKRSWGAKLTIYEPFAPGSPLVQPARITTPTQRPADGLRSLRQAAAKLGCSERTLRGHVAVGALRYVQIGHGTKRPRKMFTDADLDEFIANQTRKDAPAWPSSKTRARHTSASTYKSTVIAFSARPNKRPSGKPKR